MYFSSITTETLISEVEIICILIPSSASVRNAVLAMPACERMRSHAGIASTAFRTLAEEGINIQMISTSEIKVSVVIDEKYMELAVRVLHKAFGLEQQP